LRKKSYVPFIRSFDRFDPTRHHAMHHVKVTIKVINEVAHDICAANALIGKLLLAYAPLLCHAK